MSSILEFCVQNRFVNKMLRGVEVIRSWERKISKHHRPCINTTRALMYCEIEFVPITFFSICLKEEHYFINIDYNQFNFVTPGSLELADDE